MLLPWIKKQTGFTVIELIVVIAVIGVLVGISAIAYQSSGNRAENTKTMSAMGKYAEALQVYAVKNGAYPIETTPSCFGSYPQTKCAAVDGSTPATCNGFVAVSSQSGFDSKMKVIMGEDLPQPSSQTMKCGSKHHSGAWYYSIDGVSVEVRYLLRGNQQCTVSGFSLVSRTQLNDTTVCYVTPPPL